MIWFIIFLIWLGVFVVLPYQFIANGFSFKKRVKHYSEVSSAKQYVFKIDPKSDNPWAKRILNSPLYGTVPNNVSVIMKRITADPNEKIIGCVWTTHNLYKMGYLIATTSYIRWVQIFPFKSDDTLWQYNERVCHGQINLLGSPTLIIAGHEFCFIGFRNFGVSRKFKKLCELIQQGSLHEDMLDTGVNVQKEQQPTHKIETHNSGIADEITKLASLRGKNIITEEEFKAGKQRLLDKN